MSFVGPLSAFQKFAFQGFKFSSPTGLAKPTLLESIKAFKLPSFKLPKLSAPKPSTGTKLLIGSGIAATTVLGTELFLLEPEGQKTLDTLDSSIEKLKVISSDVGGTFEGISSFFTSNPIVLPLLLGLGIILVVKK